MDRTSEPQKSPVGITILKALFLYVLVSFLVLWFLAQPIRNAVLRSEQAVLPVVLAALGAVGLNWLVYTAIHRKRPPLPVFAYGALCLLAVVLILYGAAPLYGPLRPVLAAAGGFLALISLLLFSFWFAARPSRPAHAAAVGFRIAVGVILFFMAYQIFRDIEIRQVTWNTWLTACILVAVILARNGPRILSLFRRKTSEHRATGLAAGRIVQILGETRLDLDGDPVTVRHAVIRYTVDDVPYETRAGITRYAIWKYGKAAFVGREIPVSYDPAHPGTAFVNRIDRHFFDLFGDGPDAECGSAPE